MTNNLKTVSAYFITLVFIVTGLFAGTAMAEEKLVAGGCVTEYYLMKDLGDKFNTNELFIDIRKTGNMRGMTNDSMGKYVYLKGPSATNHFLGKTSGGITYVGYSTFDSAYGNAVAINGVEPTMENFHNGTYPLVAKYYLTYDKDNPNKVKPFIDFIFSPEGKTIINQKMISVDKQ